MFIIELSSMFIWYNKYFFLASRHYYTVAIYHTPCDVCFFFAARIHLNSCTTAAAAVSIYWNTLIMLGGSDGSYRIKWHTYCSCYYYSSSYYIYYRSTCFTVNLLVVWPCDTRPWTFYFLFSGFWPAPPTKQDWLVYRAVVSNICVVGRPCMHASGSVPHGRSHRG